MHAPIFELDEVMTVCSKIWFLWDEESDKIQGIFREIAKKQRSDVKFQHRTQYRHKDLENRLAELNSFRYDNRLFISTNLYLESSMNS
jgi:hypothetical protein